MIKERKIGEPGKVARTFLVTYIIILIIALLISDALYEIDGITTTQKILVRTSLCFIAVIFGTWYSTRHVMKKYKCTKPYEDTIRMYINIAIIGVAALSLFYFLYIVKSNVNEIKSGYEYKYVSSMLSNEVADSIVKNAEREARKSFFIVWGGIVVASAISIPLQRKRISQYVEEDIVEETPQKENSNIY